MNIEKKVIDLATEFFNKNISLKNKIGDIEEWDSLAQINLFMFLEEKLDMKFSADEVIENNSIEKIISLIKNKLKD